MQRHEPFEEEDLERGLYDQRQRGMSLERAIHSERTVFVTLCRKLGNGHRNMRGGDEVCLFYGGKTLSASRQRDDHFQLVGDCYVHGLVRRGALAK